MPAQKPDVALVDIHLPGDHLGITINTLRNHLRTIYDKLYVHSRTEATVKYLGRD